MRGGGVANPLKTQAGGAPDLLTLRGGGTAEPPKCRPAVSPDLL